ncbi:MAG: N-formylglutamate amidohydrolase [Rubrivivax sp.]|nr:N-formylglutamate amidohydrolase [Rubrivivax sp.]
MIENVISISGPLGLPSRPLVLDSPHSGYAMPPDFGAALSEADLRDGEDCYIDELWAPAATLGIPLLAAQFPRTYIDANRHAADIDPDLLDEPWPGDVQASGKARIGKALVWRTLDDGRPIYTRSLAVAEVQHRISHYHRPYHQALQWLLDAAHARFGVVHHINCHSMNAVSGKMGEGGAGVARADIVLGDRDGTSCEPVFTAFVREVLAGFGYDVKVNDPFKGVELVRAYADPAAGRHSLQLEVNKRLYMDSTTLVKTDGFDKLQQHLMQLLAAVHQQFHAHLSPTPDPA